MNCKPTRCWMIHCTYISLSKSCLVLVTSEKWRLFSPEIDHIPTSVHLSFISNVKQVIVTQVIIAGRGVHASTASGYRRQSVIVFEAWLVVTDNTVQLLALFVLCKLTASPLFRSIKWQQYVRPVELSDLDPPSMWLPPNVHLFFLPPSGSCQM